MFIARDKDDNIITIEETHSNQQYYCACCGETLITRKGEKNAHHFAHRKGTVCKDTWNRSSSKNTYDISNWHNEWQNQFPKENQEIILRLGDISHRADVMISRTIIEFQHSIISEQHFDERNNFYKNFGYRLVWLFDISSLYQNGQLTYKVNDEGLSFIWKNPKGTFNRFDISDGFVDLFFQLDDDKIVGVKSVSEYGFEQFDTTPIISKVKFLENVGLCDGKCDLPLNDNSEENNQYLQFKEKYNIKLDKQQERALLAVEGAVLLLAVPGSGKTTVLVDRLGYMVNMKNIDPSSILAITFTKNAAEEMKTRCKEKFGDSVSNITYRTINAFCKDIYEYYCAKNDIKKKDIVDNKEQSRKLRYIYTKKLNNDFCDNITLTSLKAIISYSKNMMYSSDKIDEEFAGKLSLNNPSYLFNTYKSYLEKDNLMDLDDQLVFAYKILKDNPDILEYYRNKYKYICVDEAQDTSKIQHEIIWLLSNGNSLFMVGDEDQSIYGFRAAYPKALLNFRYDYINPYICRMETNYRSAKQVVDIAQRFISANKGRYIKNMSSARGNGSNVNLIGVNNRSEQYEKLVEILKERTDDTAVLFRENESCIVLMDLLLRNNVPFNHKKPESNFFDNRVVKDIIAFLNLYLDSYDTRSFSQICNKGVMGYISPELKNYINNYTNREKEQTVYHAIIEYSSDNIETIIDFMNGIKKCTPQNVIDFICQEGYGNYLEKYNISSSCLEILNILAKNEDSIESYIERLNYLKTIYEIDINSSEDNPITLSTIHSSKGLEYDSVYIVDVIDGYLPSSKSNIFDRAKDNATAQQEERRLFYVAMTRAKNNLYMFNIKNEEQSYISELFPESKPYLKLFNIGGEIIEVEYELGQNPDLLLPKILLQKIKEEKQKEKERLELERKEKAEMKIAEREAKIKKEKELSEYHQKILEDTMRWFNENNGLGEPNLSVQAKLDFINKYGRETISQLERECQLDMGVTSRPLYDHWGNIILE